MKPLGFVLRHGWSFCAQDLHALAQHLSAISAHVLIDDLGYWSDTSQIPERSREIDWIAVGHSYGFASLLQEVDTPWVGAVGIGAFLRFPEAGLPEMQDAFARAPLRTIQAFRRRCGLIRAAPLPIPSPEGQQRLATDLDALSRLSISMPMPKYPNLFLHGAHDRVVQTPIPGSILVHSGHNLGIEEFSWCAQQINTFVRSSYP